MKHRRLQVLCLICLLLGIVAIFGGRSLSHALTFELLKRKQAPAQHAMFELLLDTEHPAAFLRKLWASERIPHRNIALQFIKDHHHSVEGLAEVRRELVDQGLADVDFANRELALGILSETDPDAFSLAVMRLLKDVDQAARLTALHHIKDRQDARWIPVLMASLDDPDPMVVASAASKLRRWTDQDFGVRLHHAIRKAGAISEGTDDAAEEEKRQVLADGVMAWKNWWRESGPDVPKSDERFASTGAFMIQGYSAEDFDIQTLEGQTIQLSALKGKAVLLNFWTTWCSACMTEMPDLNQLHREYEGKLIVLGVALDGDDGHGHEHASIVDMEEAREVGWEAVHSNYQDDEEVHDHAAHEDQADDHDHSSSGPDFDKIEKKVRRVVRKKHLEYPIALDPTFRLGVRFNGNELPTNVLIDADGLVRRRFLGARPLASWKAMLEEIGITPSH